MLRKIDEKCLEIFEMWYCRRMEKMSWTDRVKMEKYDIVSERGKKYSTHTIKRRNAKRIDHISRRNCILKHVIGGKIEERSNGTTRKKV
jgi:hypothetical protein